MGSGPPPPLRKSQMYRGFLALLVLLPWLHVSQSYQAGHHLHASEMPFKSRLTGGPMMVRL